MWPIIILVSFWLLISHYHKKIIAEEEEELNDFYKTCAKTDAIMDEHYQRLATSEDEKQC